LRQSCIILRQKNNRRQGDIMPIRSPTLLPIVLLAFGALIAAPASAGAQAYPDRAVKIIVPIGPSGSYDIVGRLLADQLSKRLGQSVVVENRPGAGTIVGTQAVINAPPDGYTLLIGGLSNIVFNAGLYQKLPYDPLTDLVRSRWCSTFPTRWLRTRTFPTRRRRRSSRRRRRIRAAEARQCRDRHRPAYSRRCLHEVDRHQIPGGTLSRIVGRVSRSARRPRRPVRRFDPGSVALHQIGQAKGIGILSAKRSARF
jgi:hypothetical protein